MPPSLDVRAARHAALGDPIRLAIVDELTASDRSPVELRRLTGSESNLLAHHLDVLEDVGLIARKRSSGDQRRRYVQLQRRCARRACPGRTLPPPAGPVRVHPELGPLTAGGCVVGRADRTACGERRHPPRRSGAPRRRPSRTSRRTRPEQSHTTPARRRHRRSPARRHGVRPSPRGTRPGSVVAALVDRRPRRQPFQVGVRPHRGRAPRTDHRLVDVA